ncbi:MAG: Undecaprenyl-diphosphatase [Candidatus Moranbacteria bacterium GW2011_GWF2_34_56]|nr:MAG: Undecaprenyl-diphosphatase [Candidatus Moranbacteria bacterium GW2011_GWF1_34_10]KKP65319.1 MAG: Undecaprenyl-diphosphatase [Candidatus Moranbacteria bacterium GW2011_GWF2_34_56]HBI16568.1 undecaprenyl-diphosphatase UppP [Candidatus Moranbacteria bacterium]
MDFIQSITLGIVQGLGEFLPISSTAHLILVPFFTGWEDPGLAFDVAMHAGTLLAVIAYFWRDWLDIFKLAFWGKNYKSEKYNSNILWLLVIGTIPGALIGFSLEDLVDGIFRNPYLIAFTLSLFGLILFLLDKYASHKRELDKINLKDVLIIGLAQAVAIVPGVSRSGATISAGLALGLSRVSAARFSFLLSTPIIFGATLSQTPDLIRGGIDSVLIIGIIFSAFSGYLAIKYLIKFVENYSYKVFFWYRLLLAFIIILAINFR